MMSIALSAAGPRWIRLLNGRGLACMVVLATALVGVSSPARATGDGDELAHQPKSEYQSRRHRLMDQLKDGIVVLIGAQEDEFGEVG